MQLTPAALAERLRNPHPPALLDVRQPEEHAFCALPGSLLIPLGELPDRLDELAAWRDREIVVYCHHGVRSTHAIAHLRAAGFNRLWNLAGGLDRWSLEVDPATPRY
ncbi:MAG: rhodanese-like domain-containing protein [Verrucomicrobiota bacterium]